MKYTQTNAKTKNEPVMASAGAFRRVRPGTQTIKTIESRLELKAPCPNCGIYHVVKLHDDGVCTVLCRCTVSRCSPDGLNDVYVVDPATVRSQIARRVREVEVPRDH